MREILFRGQTRRKGENVRMDGTPVEGNWVYGGIFPANNGGDFAIIYQQEPEIEKFPVYSDTVGQYTGVTDKNRMKIFEDDIVKEPDDKCIGIIKYGVYDNPFNSDGLGGHMGFYVDWQEGSIKLRRRDIMFWADKVEVIGNVHDNPELLKEGE